MPSRSLPSEGSWSGQACVVVGGGPSLQDFNWSTLQGVPRVVVINRAVAKVPTADIFFTEDSRYFPRFGNEPAFRDFKGVKVVHLLEDSYVSDLASFLDDLVVIRKKRNDKFWSKSFDEGLSVSSNSAVGAVNIADILGAKTIYLLGMDCRRGPNKESNFHSDYSDDWVAGTHQLDSFVSDWKYWVRVKCRANIVNVINPALPSAIDCFPTIDYEGFYRWLRESSPSIPPTTPTTSKLSVPAPNASACQ